MTVLKKEDGSPLAPESDEETAKKADSEAKEAKNSEARIQNPEVRIDLPGIDQRILALPIPPRDYVSLDAGKTGILFITERVQNPAAPPEERETATLYKFELKTRKTDKVLENLRRFVVSQRWRKDAVPAGRQLGDLRCRHCLPSLARAR